MRALIKNRLKLAQFILSAVFVVLFSFSPAYGLSPMAEGASSARGDSQPMELFGSSGVFVVVTNTMLFIVGALSVIMLIIGGLRYVISAGNASAVTNAKNTILYAIVGLIVALLAYAAINFVLTALIPGAASSWTNV